MGGKHQNPVDTPTEKETAEVAKIWSDVDNNYIAAGVMSADEVRDIRRSLDDSPYSTLADDIEGVSSEVDNAVDEALDEWEENKHPRDGKGRFTSGGNFSKAEPDNKGSAKKVENSSKRGKVKRKRNIIHLSEDEFAQVQSAFITDVTKEEREQQVLDKRYGNYIYKGILREDGTRDIVSKRKNPNV